MLNISTIADNRNHVAKTAITNTRAEIAQNKLDDEKTRFLKIFIAQIQNQIPTEPIENKEMSQLTAVFSQVEQQVETNKNLEKLVKAQENRNLGTPLSYLGTEVSTDSSYANLKNNEANFSYNLPEECSDVIIKIKDNKGRLITTEKGSRNVGYNEFLWNGKNEHGVRFPDDEYKIDIEAYKLDKKNILQPKNNIKLIDGKADFAYVIPDDFDNLELSIKDQAHNILYKTSLKQNDSNFTWNGRSNSGATVKDGEYLFEIKGRKLVKSEVVNSNITLNDHPVELKYNVLNSVKDILVSVKDENMKEIFKDKITKTIGENSFSWDGKDNLGNHLPKDKKYNIEISSITNPSQSNNIVVANTIFKGIVTSIDSSQIEPSLTVNGKQIALNKIKSVSLV